MKLMKNKFLFILIISIATLILLIVGALSLYKDNSLTFSSDGYIIETNTKTNTKYYFSANTKYKENVEEKITFSDKENNKVVVDPASFVHYDNGNVSFLQKGALVNLADINNPMVSYYNITNENTIVYEQEHYTVTSNNKKINIDSFVGRINDSKYLIASKNLTLKIPTDANRISGDFFEVNFIEEGIVKIYNKDNNYQVTAQDSYLYIGDEITISLGDGKIFYDGEAKMLLSQITINNNENINLDVEEKNEGSGGSGSGGGSGEDGEGADGEGEGDGTGEGAGEGANEGTGEGAGGSGIGGNNTTASPQIELIEAIVTSTTLDLTMQLNNASLARGNIMAYLTNVSTGNKETPRSIELNNGTFKLPYTSLTPDTNYALTIVETGVGSEKQYFQKTFITKELGITLEKTYATSDTLAYNLIFDENTEVTRARISIYDNNGTNEDISPNEFTISAKDLNNSAIFTGLKSNTSYSINVDTVWINNTAYSNVYTINRIDTTLKETPIISGVNVTTNVEEVKFNIELRNIKDKDKSIISYTYNIYLADDITLENIEPQIQYSVTKNDSDPLVLNLNEIDALKTGVDYRCKIIAEYNDNEMIREVSTDYSNNFLIRSKPKINFELKSATMNKVEGTISLIDANCTVPMSGRTCSNSNNTFTLRYYEASTEENTDNDRIIKFDSSKLTSELSLTDLKSNTTYAVKVFGNYYDDDNVLHPNVQLGDTFYITTDKSENIYFEVAGDNISGKNKDGTDNIDNVVTFDAKLTAPQNSNIIEEISTVTFKLYSGRYNTKDKLIGTYTIDNKTSIEDLFNNITINNGLFTDTTKHKVDKINTLEKLIRVTNNSNGTLNGSYTVEVTDVLDSTGKNEITVENNVYTFNLTSSYYLDARIETNPNENYITVTPILKEHLTEEEYGKLIKTVKNLDELNDDTIVGITIENSLSDMFVDSAYKYEKAIVNYTVCNDTIRDCDNYLNKLTDDDPNNDREAQNALKIISVDMGNKYQPKTQTIYLDSSEYKDAKKYFIRGYNYKIGFYISFMQEDGAKPHYNNSKIHKVISIEKQSPIYTQYISTSDKTSVTYRYNFKDIDSVLVDNNFYYTIGDDKKNYLSVENSLIADNQNHDVTIPIESINNYTLYYSTKNTSDQIIYNEITTSNFESEYTYNEENAYTIIDSKDNILKIKLEQNDVIKRAVAHKVVISTIEKNKVSDYVRYFLDSKLNTISENTGEVDEKGNPITIDYKYILIDYANISRFMGHKLKITVYSYFDSGLIGYNQAFNNGLVLQNRLKNKYLNIYNSGSNTISSIAIEDKNMGIYLLKEPFKMDGENIYIYNHLMDTKNYNSSIGATYYNTDNLSDNIGIKFGITYTNAGIILTNNEKEYTGYDAKVLKEAELKTNNNTYLFETIIPIISVNTSKNTINSIKVNITPSGIYGNKQFIKDNKAHNKAYIELYSDEECANLLKTTEANINITGNEEAGYSATINQVEFSDLNPATTYYFKIYAYVNNERIQLYDSSSGTEYVTKTYSSTTLNANGIIRSIKYAVEPKTYKGESSEKYLTWKLNLKNRENYKLRFELYEPDGTITETNPETGEEITKINYKAVKFDGSNANSCNKDVSGDSSNGYVKNCYILVDKNEIENANNKDQIYKFTGDNFIFGGNYYKLLIYAIPYTNNSYIEDQKLLLYQNDALTTTPIQTVNGVEHNITIPTLNEATFSLSNSLMAGYLDTSKGYYISFVPTVYDTHKVIKYGTYTVRLKDEKGNIIDQQTNVTAGIKETGTLNEQIKFTGLTSNTLYYVELLYETYRNNIGFTEDQKIATIPFTDFIYTPISNDITLGTITAGNATGKAVTLTYNGSANLSEKIVRVDYTVSLKGGSSKTTGTYKIDSNTSSIFTISTDKTPKLTIDVSNSMYSTNTSFNFRTGNTYIITTQYYYLNNGKEVLLMDQVTGNTTYTTILNL